LLLLIMETFILCLPLVNSSTLIGGGVEYETHYKCLENVDNNKSKDEWRERKTKSIGPMVAESRENNTRWLKL